MVKFLRHDPKELARQTPVSEVTDAQVFQFLITSVTKALLGPIVSAELSLTDKPKNIISEDKLFNLNGHSLWGGQDGSVRFYYYHSLYITKKGCVIIRRDGVKLEVLGWYGNLKRQKGQLIWKVALRDRRYDGTKATNDCALEHFPYDDGKLNGNFFAGAKSVELYIFSYSPGSHIAGAGGGKQLQDFCANPFAFTDRPELFLKLFHKAWESERSPGQWSGPIQDAGDLMEGNFSTLCKRIGYDLMEVAASHYHVAMWCKHTGYRFTIPAQEQNFERLTANIERIKASGVHLERNQESWTVVLQSLPQESIPKELYAGGAKWQQDNITLPNLWLWKPLTDKAKELKPKLVE